MINDRVDRRGFGERFVKEDIWIFCLKVGGWGYYLWRWEFWKKKSFLGEILSLDFDRLYLRSF